MVEKLTIKNFGPIKDVTLELRAVNIFIGDQGTGKSTIAKVLIAAQNTAILDFIEEGKSRTQNKTEIFKDLLKKTGITNYLYPTTEIEYKTYLYVFRYVNNIATVKGNSGQELVVDIETKFSFNFTYIPAERNLAVALLYSLYALMQTGTALPPLFLRFGDRFDKSRKEKEVFDFTEVLGLIYEATEGKDKIILKDNEEEVLLSDSSSGIQSVITLLSVFDAVAKRNINPAGKPTAGNLLVIEEPEISIFPETQYKLLKYIMSNLGPRYNVSMAWNDQIFITTHSPYILASLNNMMYAQIVGKEHRAEANQILEQKYWVLPDNVSAFRMLTDGTCEDIMDRQEEMIHVEKIDEISRELNSDFDLLQNIQLGIKA